MCQLAEFAKLQAIGAVYRCMNDDMDNARSTWIAAVKLASVLSIVAALVAVGVSSIGDVPAIAIVAPVMIVAFVASWVQTGRVQHGRTHHEHVRRTVLVIGH